MLWLIFRFAVIVFGFFACLSMPLPSIQGDMWKNPFASFILIGLQVVKVNFLHPWGSPGIHRKGARGCRSGTITAERRLKDGWVHPSQEPVVFQKLAKYPEGWNIFLKTCCVCPFGGMFQVCANPYYHAAGVNFPLTGLVNISKKSTAVDIVLWKFCNYFASESHTGSRYKIS